MSECVYILLPVHNRKKITHKFIVSLSQQSYQNYHLLLIDDGSTDGTDDMVREKILAEKLTVIKGKGNWWWAGSLQQGIDWLKNYDIQSSDIILMINDDVTFKADFLERGVSFILKNSGSLLLSRLFDEEKDMVVESGVNADLKHMSFSIAENPEDINCFSTRGLFMRWDVLQNIGGFYPILLPHYWSDYEFTIRASRKGIGLKTSSKIYLTAMREETGVHALQLVHNMRVVDLLKQVFSKRSIPNPIYRTSFIIFTFSSWSHMFGNIMNTWANIMFTIMKLCKKTLKNSLERYQLKNTLRKAQGKVKIILGAASTGQAGWIATNYPVVDVTDSIIMDGFFPRNSVSVMLAEHVWEHLEPELAVLAVENCFRCLEPGGYLRLAVPDGNHSDKNYIEQVRPAGSGAGSDDHKILYTFDTMLSLLEKAGFHVRLLEWFDENNAFHTENWSENDGLIIRSTRFDERNKNNPTAYTSLIVDAVKPS